MRSLEFSYHAVKDSKIVGPLSLLPASRYFPLCDLLRNNRGRQHSAAVVSLRGFWTGIYEQFNKTHSKWSMKLSNPSATDSNCNTVYLNNNPSLFAWFCFLPAKIQLCLSGMGRHLPDLLVKRFPWLHNDSRLLWIMFILQGEKRSNLLEEEGERGGSNAWKGCTKSVPYQLDRGIKKELGGATLVSGTLPLLFPIGTSSFL